MADSTPYASAHTQFDYSLPAAPAPTTPAAPKNRFDTGTDAYRLNDAYLKNLQREATDSEIQYRGSRFNLTPLEQQLQDIAGSSEAQTYGRARAEVNPIIDAEIQRYYNDIGTERQKATSQLGNLQSTYNSDYGSLTFAQQQQMDALNALRGQITQDTEYNAGQLQSKFAPAAQQAYQTANRRGLLDSSIALNLVNEGYKPIQTSLSNLYQTAQRQLTDAEQKRLSATQKYQYDVSSLQQKQSQQAQAIKDALALYTQQQQQGANAADASRSQKIFAQGGNYVDSFRNYQLQQQQLQELIRYQQAQNQLSNRQQDFAEKQANRV